jgi:hypothetical protein
MRATKYNSADITFKCTGYTLTIPHCTMLLALVRAASAEEPLVT